MKDSGFFLVFLVILVILALAGSNKSGTGLFASKTASSTTTIKSSTSTRERVYSKPVNNTSQRVTTSRNTKRLTNMQIEQRLAKISHELDTLKEKVRQEKLREPASPYRGLVTLSSANARSTDTKTEYLTLRAGKVGDQGIAISNWYFQSYVTDETAAISDGDRVITKWRQPLEGPIVLLQNEQAYVITNESPLKASFHENTCTGYLRSEKDFYPSLRMSCPAPLDEMKRYGNIALDNDACYDFVGGLNRCSTPEDEAVDDANINGSCRRFVETSLNYNGCVTNHVNTPLFDDVGNWYIYLNRDEDLWREKREIIRLMDEHDKVIDVVEY